MASPSSLGHVYWRYVPTNCPVVVLSLLSWSTNNLNQMLDYHQISNSYAVLCNHSLHLTKFWQEQISVYFHKCVYFSRLNTVYGVHSLPVCASVCVPTGGEHWSALLKWWEQVQFESCSACQWLLELQGWWNCSCRYLKAVVIHLKMLRYNPFNFSFLAAITLSTKNLSKQCSLVI